MDKIFHIFEVIPKISTKIGLAALVIAVLCVILYQIVNKAPSPPKNQTGRILLTIVIGIFTLALVTVVFALREPAPVNPPIPIEDREVDLDFRNAALRQVLESCADQVGNGTVLALDEKLNGTFSISVKRARLSDVMTQICNLKNCKWEIRPGQPPALFVRSRSTEAR